MTETTQPDPQVVAELRRAGWVIDRPAIERDEAAGIEGDPDDEVYYDDAGNGWRIHKPLTVADIPAGQGPASLYIDKGDEAAVWFKHADGRGVVAYLRMDYDGSGSHAKAALWDHLAATLPHVTTEEEA